MKFQVKEGIEIEIDSYDYCCYLKIFSEKILSPEVVVQFMISFGELVEYGACRDLIVPSDIEDKFAYVMRFDYNKQPVNTIKVIR